MSTIVLIHALGSGHRAWTLQRETLGSRGHRVEAPDLPGHGGVPGPFTLERAAAAVGDVIARTTGPVHLVGISAGASVALLTALAQGDRVASLIVSGGVARTAAADTVQRTVMRLLPAGAIVAMLKGMYSGGNPERLPVAVEDLRRAGKGTILDGLRDLGRLDLRPRLTEIKAPALVLCGGKDKANLGPARELADGLADAELRIVPGAGHLWNLEDPALFADTVAGFADRHPDPARSVV